MSLTCPICFNVYYKPVKLPCSHTLCKDCLERSLDMSTLCCPICRYRLSTWKRRMKDISSCIDKDCDAEIESLFPRYYLAKSQGLDVSISGSEAEVLREVTNSNDMHIKLATPGSIKSEFTAAIARITQERNVEQSVRDEASLALTRQMMLESSLENHSLYSDPEDFVGSSSLIVSPTKPNDSPLSIRRPSTSHSQAVLSSKPSNTKSNFKEKCALTRPKKTKSRLPASRRTTLRNDRSRSGRHRQMSILHFSTKI